MSEPVIDLSQATGEEIAEFTINLVWGAGRALGVADYRSLLAGLLRLRKGATDPEVIRDLNHKIRLFQAAADFKDELQAIYLDMQPAVLQ